MTKGSATRKTIALFVLAFLCLNVAGALCLTYCTQIAMAAAPVAGDDSHLSEHCRRANKEAQEKNQSLSVNANAPSCCMLPVSLFATPVEKQTRFSEILVADATPVVNVEFHGFIAPVFYNSRESTPVYRPPPLDHRVDRLLNCVIRI